MATGSRTTGLTYEDLLEMFPEQDNVRRDLIDGELIVTPSPLRRHQQVVGRLHVLLFRYAEEHGGEALTGPFDVFFSDRNVVEPDVLYVRAENLRTSTPTESRPTGSRRVATPVRHSSSAARP